MNRFWLCTGQESRRREHQELSISLSVLTDGEPDEEEHEQDSDQLINTQRFRA